jgi:thiol-disulfide isomerase/thioredoxin
VFFSATAFAGDALYSFKGKSYTVKNMNPAMQQSVYETNMEQYENMGHIIDGAILENHINELAKKKNVDPKVIENDLFSLKTPTEAEMKKWYEKNKARIPYPFEKIKNEIANMLKNEKKNSVRAELLTKLKKKGSFKLNLKVPVAPVFKISSKGYPNKGNKNAKVTLVEFADYQCPHCKKASGMVKDVIKKYGNKINVVYLDFRINR